MKRVVINEDKNTIRFLIHWEFAHRRARQQCNFQQLWADRVRFERRIDNTEKILNPILTKEHRNYIFNARFQ